MIRYWCTSNNEITISKFITIILEKSGNNPIEYID